MPVLTLTKENKISILRLFREQFGKLPNQMGRHTESSVDRFAWDMFADPTSTIHGEVIAFMKSVKPDALYFVGMDGDLAVYYGEGVGL